MKKKLMQHLMYVKISLELKLTSVVNNTQENKIG
jgi:hypothetical protein